MHLRCKLRQLREVRDLSLPDAERATGISRGTLSAIERGKAIPLDKHVEAIETFYGRPWPEWYSRTGAAALQEGDEAA